MTDTLVRPPQVRPCPGCGADKTCRSYPSGRNRWVCLPCDAAQAKAWRERNREQSRLIVRRAQIRRKYGLTLEDYDRMVAERGGRCDICGNPPPVHGARSEDRKLHIDHDHQTGQVRGLLCGTCNKALGWLERNLAGALTYLDHA